jgi:hypothetical protein
MGQDHRRVSPGLCHAASHAPRVVIDARSREAVLRLHTLCERLGRKIVERRVDRQSKAPKLPATPTSLHAIKMNLSASYVIYCSVFAI